MKKCCVLACFCAFCVMACATSSTFVKTGPGFEPLDDDELITFFLSKKPQGNYQQIGIVTFSAGSFSERLAATRRLAQKYGANGIIIKKSLADKEGVTLVKYKAGKMTQAEARQERNTGESSDRRGLVSNHEFILIRCGQ